MKLLILIRKVFGDCAAGIYAVRFEKMSSINVSMRAIDELSENLEESYDDGTLYNYIEEINTDDNSEYKLKLNDNCLGYATLRVHKA